MPKSQSKSPSISQTGCLTYARILACLSAALGCFMLLANIVAAKLWHIGSMVLPGDLILFPLVYVLGDVLAAIYKEKTANLVAFFICLVNLFGLFSFMVTDALPGVPGIENPDLSAAFGMSERIILASVIGFAVSRPVNNRLLIKLFRHKSTGKPRFFLATYFSSTIGRIFDVCLFNTIAYAGRLPISGLLMSMLGSFVLGSLIEFVFSPFKKWLYRILAKRIKTASRKT